MTATVAVIRTFTRSSRLMRFNAGLSYLQTRSKATKADVELALEGVQSDTFDIMPLPAHLDHLNGVAWPKTKIPKKGGCGKCGKCTNFGAPWDLPGMCSKRQHMTQAVQPSVETALEAVKSGPFDIIPHPAHLEHSQVIETEAETALLPVTPPIGTHALPHPIWTSDELDNVKITHRPPEGILDWMAYGAIKIMRNAFDTVSGFHWGVRDETKWVNRICFLETVAGVPGMVAAMTRHLHSLRRLQRDYGWIHTLLEEAENERMHLMTALELKNPSWLFKMGVAGAQGGFVTAFSITYLISPRFCHRFVGYLEEEAVKTYTKCLEDIESGPMQHWQTTKSPDVAIRYWKLSEDATMKDVILAMRADEAHHRIINHTFASMKSSDYNPYEPGK